VAKCFVERASWVPSVPINQSIPCFVTNANDTKAYLDVSASFADDAALVGGIVCITIAFCSAVILAGSYSLWLMNTRFLGSRLRKSIDKETLLPGDKCLTQHPMRRRSAPAISWPAADAAAAMATVQTEHHQGRAKPINPSPATSVTAAAVAAVRAPRRARSKSTELF